MTNGQGKLCQHMRIMNDRFLVSFHKKNFYLNNIFLLFLPRHNVFEILYWSFRYISPYPWTSWLFNFLISSGCWINDNKEDISSRGERGKKKKKLWKEAPLLSLPFIILFWFLVFLSILRFSHMDKWEERVSLMTPIMYYSISYHDDNKNLRKKRGAHLL